MRVFLVYEAFFNQGSKMETVEVKVYTEPGKGRKQCKTCSKYVGMRSRICVCGAEFVSSAAKPNADKPAKPAKVAKTQSAKQENAAKNEIPHSENIGEYRLLNVTTPQGGCPVKLTGTDADSVSRWAHAVREEGYKTSRHYTVAAIGYYVREFYDIHGLDHETIIEHLFNWDGKPRPMSSNTRFEPVADEVPAGREIVHYETGNNDDSVLEDE